MPIEETTDMVWYIIIALLVVVVMIGFYIFFSPNVEGGWLGALFNGIASLLRNLGI